MASRPKAKRKRPSAGERLGLALLQSVREMKAGMAARVTKVEPNEVARYQLKGVRATLKA